MRRALIAPVVVLVVVLLAGSGVVVADAARPERVAEGITVAGIDLGGMTPAAAHARLERELVGRLRRSLVVAHNGRVWRLSARRARVRTDVDALVADAVRRSQAGGVLGRTLRRVRGGEVHADLQPTTSFSRPAVRRFLARVRRQVRRPAQDASLRLTPAGVELHRDQRGLELRVGELRTALDAALATPRAPRRIVAHTRRIRPKVSAARLARQNAVVLIADRAANTLKLYDHLKLAKTYGVAAGQPDWPTPAGEFTIVNKVVDPTWSVPRSSWAGDLGGTVIAGGAPENPLKARWLGITDGVGIHGTSDDGSIGSNASHGCLRMHVADVIDLYPRVPVGARILIA